MKKLILLLIIISLFAPVIAYAQTATPTSSPSSRSVTVIGDSLTTTLGAGRRLSENFDDINFYSEIGRNWTQGLGILTEVKNAGNLKDVLVFALGTNGGVSQANIESLIAATPGKTIVLMTIYRENVGWLETTNQAINNAATNPNIKIADWHTLASTHPEWFGDDGTHPSSSGYTALADLLTETIGSSDPNPTNPPNPGTSNCVITKVGNPTGVAPVCPESGTNGPPVVGPCGPLLTWAQRVSGSLERGQATWYNRMMADISNGPECNFYNAYKRTGQNLSDPLAVYWYWCTFIVIDSYNLAGLSGMDLTHADVVDMHLYMTNTPGYQFLDYRTDKRGALSRVRPGYAFFVEKVFLENQGNHTGLINTISLDSRGNGTITTLESNNYNKSNTWVVAGWNILNPDYGDRPLVGFGGPKN